MSDRAGERESLIEAYHAIYDVKDRNLTNDRLRVRAYEALGFLSNLMVDLGIEVPKRRDGEGRNRAAEYYELTSEDVGKVVIKMFGQNMSVSGLMGRVLPGDVGKRITRVRDEADAQWVLQVESDDQLHRRCDTAISTVE